MPYVGIPQFYSERDIAFIRSMERTHPFAGKLATEICDACGQPLLLRPFVLVAWRNRPDLPVSHLHQDCAAATLTEHLPGEKSP